MTNGALLFSLRAARLVLHVVVGLVLAAALAILRRGLPRDRMAQWWLAVLLDILNIRVQVSGTASPRACVLVANHVSWLDIPVIAAQGQVRFVAKSDIARWPVVGWLTTAAGSYYIRRGGGGTGRVARRIGPFVRRGGRVLFFPEGTTTDGRSVGRFHARLFALAADSGLTVQPLALRYGVGADGTRVAPYVGDDELFWHILRVLREPELHVELIYCAPIPTAGLDRKALAQRAEEAVRQCVEPGDGLADDGAPASTPDDISFVRL